MSAYDRDSLQQNKEGHFSPFSQARLIHLQFPQSCDVVVATYLKRSLILVGTLLLYVFSTVIVYWNMKSVVLIRQITPS